MTTAELADVLRKVERSRVRLIAGSLTAASGDDSAPWFGTLSASLTIKASTRHAHAATDGTHFFYNPKVWTAIDEREGAFVWAHEVLHCGLCHMYRKPEWVEWHEWNVCTDLAIHSILIPLAQRYNWLVPKGVLYEARYDNMSAEQIAYARKKEAEQNQPPPPPNEPQDEPDDDEQDENEQEQEQEQEDSDDTDDDDSEDSDEGEDDGGTPGDEDEPQGDEEQEGDFPTQGEESDSEREGDAEGVEESGEDGDGDAQDEQEGDGTLTPEDDLRPPPPPEPGAQPGEGDTPDDQDGSPGERHDERAQPRTEDDWQQMVEQAMAVAKKAGAMPGNVERAIEQGRPTGVAWRDIMRQFIESCVPSRQTWGRPSKRHLATGVYLPSAQRENIPPLLIGVDTSASITPEMLNDFAEQVQVIWTECKPRALYVVYCDTDVADVDVFDRSQGDDEIEMHASGGGGTEFQPVFDYCQEMIDAGEWEKPAACVYLTDLECWSVPQEPDYPVLWAAVPGTYAEAPFGETVRLD